MIRRYLMGPGLGLALVFAFSALPAHAQQKPSPSAVATARELVEIKGAVNMLNTLVPGIVESAKNNILPTHPQLSKELNDVAVQLRKEFEPRRQDLINDFATLYAQTFTEQEMKEAIAFYKSAAGKKFVTEEPVVVDQALSRIQGMADKISMEVISRFRAEMKKKGHDL